MKELGRRLGLGGESSQKTKIWELFVVEKVPEVQGPGETTVRKRGGPGENEEP